MLSFVCLCKDVINPNGKDSLCLKYFQLIPLSAFFQSLSLNMKLLFFVRINTLIGTFNEKNLKKSYKMFHITWSSWILSFFLINIHEWKSAFTLVQLLLDFPGCIMGTHERVYLGTFKVAQNSNKRVNPNSSCHEDLGQLSQGKRVPFFTDICSWNSTEFCTYFTPVKSNTCGKQKNILTNRINHFFGGLISIRMLLTDKW